jgi:hypothetical protein
MAGSPQSFLLTRNDSALPIPTSRAGLPDAGAELAEDELDVESAQDLRGDAAVANAVLGTPRGGIPLPGGACGNVDLGVVGWLLIGSIPGVILGSQWSIRLPEAVVRWRSPQC